MKNDSDYITQSAFSNINLYYFNILQNKLYRTSIMVIASNKWIITLLMSRYIAYNFRQVL